MTLLETLEQRAAALDSQIKALMVDGQVPAEKREEWHGMMSALNEVEATIGKAKDEELNELRSIINGKKEAGTESSKREDAFRSFILSGASNSLLEQRASMSTTDANGGYLVPENLHAPLVDKLRAMNPVLANATLFTLTGGSASIELPRKATHGAVTNAAETGARSEQNAPTIGNTTLTCYDYYTDQRATQLFLDTTGGAETMLLEWIYEDIMEQAGIDAVSGNGTTKCKGLFAETSLYSTQLSGTAGTLANADLVNLYFKLAAGYRQNAKFMMNTATLKAAAQLADPAAADKALLERVNGVWTMYGKEILETESAPALASGAYPVAFGDIAKAYAVGIHKTPSVMRDPYTATPYIRFYGLGRIGGCAWNPAACALLKSATS